MPRTNDERPRCQGEQLRTTLSSALQDFKGKSNVLMKAIPKQPPEGDASRMGPMWRYDAKLVQGKHVPSALNAPASVLTMLMRKDAWAGRFRSSQLIESKKGQLMGRVQK